MPLKLRLAAVLCSYKTHAFDLWDTPQSVGNPLTVNSDLRHHSDSTGT